MHLDDEQIERFLHEELPVEAQHGVWEHLGGCAQCRERLEAAGRDEAGIFALLRQVDHRPPVVTAEALARRAGPARAVWGRWAAGILLFGGIAGAAYAAPGSPLRDWVRSAAAWIRISEPPSEVSTPTESPDARVAGIAAVPGPEFVIAFESPEPRGEARVTLTTGTEITVRAPGGAASFTSSADRLLIANSGSGASYEIEIPRSARRVEIQVAGKRVFLKEGSRIQSDGSAETVGKLLIPLSP